MRNNSSGYSQSGISSEGGGSESPIDSELRPAEMLVHNKREDAEVSAAAAAADGPIIKIKVLHDTNQHEVSLPAQSTFGELKRILTQETGLEPEEQKLLFRGKEKGNEECLHKAGVKDMSKVVLLEDWASKERKLEQLKRDQGISKACDAISLVRAEVNKLAEKVSALESKVHGGAKVEEKEFLMLTELLMVQLLKLDGIKAEGEAKVQRRTEVRRIQGYVDTVDSLKARNSKPFADSSNAASVTTQWEKFESGAESLSAPPPLESSTKVTDEWERFE